MIVIKNLDKATSYDVKTGENDYCFMLMGFLSRSFKHVFKYKLLFITLRLLRCFFWRDKSVFFERILWGNDEFEEAFLFAKVVILKDMLFNHKWAISDTNSNYELKYLSDTCSSSGHGFIISINNAKRFARFILFSFTVTCHAEKWSFLLVSAFLFVFWCLSYDKFLLK